MDDLPEDYSSDDLIYFKYAPVSSVTWSGAFGVQKYVGRLHDYWCSLYLKIYRNL